MTTETPPAPRAGDAASRRRRAGELARRHWPLIGVLALAAVVRAAAAVAYRPALMWTDSWNYLYASTLPGGFTGDKPGGYASLLRGLRIATDDLSVVTTLQHLAGLLSGILVYALLRRRQVSPGVAAAVVAIVLLDAYAIALEQHVLAEACFTLSLCVWAWLAVASARTAPLVAAAGLALAAAASLRAVAVFVVPVWIAYCLWAFPDLRRRLAGPATVLVALVLYVGYHDATAGGFGLTQMSGWSLYARVAEIGDCRGRDVPAAQRKLCPDPSPDLREWRGDSVAYHQYAPQSPSERNYGGLLSLSPDDRLRADGELRRFARTVVRDRPLRFAAVLGRESLRFLRPGAGTRLPHFDEAITFPAEPRPVPAVARPAQRSYAPDYRPPAHPPAAALERYGRWVHVPPWLLALAILASLASLAAPVLGRARGRLADRAETFLLTGAGCALLVGGALNHFETRYAVPAFPLLLAGGALAATDLWRLRRSPPRGQG